MGTGYLLLLVLFTQHLFRMPWIVKVRILEGRDLPVMDRASELTDAYVDVKFHDRSIFRTQVCPKTLCPKWNSGGFLSLQWLTTDCLLKKFASFLTPQCSSHTMLSDWFRFEVDDEQIQEDLLQIKVFDKDTVTANDPIGKVR